MRYRFVLATVVLSTFFISLSNQLQAQSQTVVCASDDMERHSCPVDTRGGVRLSRQISGSPCTQGSTWGYDATGIWVDKGCRAEFAVLPVAVAVQGQALTVVCASDDMERHSCPADTRRGVLLSRQISGSPCILGSTWGYDSSGIWVDKGCRAEFRVFALAGATATSSPAGSGTSLAGLSNMASPELIGQLTNALSITPEQARGGAGALFSLAKSRLSSTDFSRVAAAVPGMDGLLKAAPASDQLSALSNLGGLGGLASVGGSFQKLGLSPGMVSKFVPLLVNYVGSRGGSTTASLLAKVLQ